MALDFQLKKLLGKKSIGKVDHLQQEVLRTSHKTPAQALFQAYEILTEEQKVAFILARGIPSLLCYQQHSIKQMMTGPDRETSHLSVLY